MSAITESTLDPATAGKTLRLSEVIAALSYALDITEGQPEGHAARTCLLGMRIARELRFSAEQSSALFYALLLKDLGCSSNSSKVCYLFGADDRIAKGDLKKTDWSSVRKSLGYIAQNVTPNGSLWQKVNHFARVAISGRTGAKELVEMRCDRGARIAKDLQMPEATAAAIRGLDEHWDGSGYPDGLAGDAIPIFSRIMGLAQTVEVFAASSGREAGIDIAIERRGTWFDPTLVDALLSFQSDANFWTTFFSDDPRKAITSLEPPDQLMPYDSATLDRIAHAFAQVIDAKSPWTFKHSEGVSKIAVGLGTTMMLGDADVRILRRCGLLHDIGKLGVSNLILDKPGKLTPEEITEMRKHTGYTYHILEQVAGFRSIAGLAAAHHERLDGKGYHLGLTADQLSTSARILAVADMYEALTAKRPYRADLTDEEVMSILQRNVGPGICPEVFEALKTYIATSGSYIPTPVAA